MFKKVYLSDKTPKKTGHYFVQFRMDSPYGKAYWNGHEFLKSHNLLRLLIGI